MLKPGFLLFCVYVMGYLCLRAYGEIVYQTMPIPTMRGVVQEHVVGTDYSIPRWRRQLYRAFFSPLMVAEEEGRRLAAGGRGTMQSVEDFGRGLLPR